MGYEEKMVILSESKKRMRGIKFGDPVTNICASDSNPRRLSYFIRRTGKKRQYAQCTDKKGKFWETGIDVIYPGHIDLEKCKELFAPVWKAEYT